MKIVLRIAVGVLVLAVISWVAGCVSTVTPPANPVDPVTVYLIESGRHSGLVMPTPDGGRVEYAFGDWDWYARNCDRWYHVFDTVLWPTRGALGRRRLPTGDSNDGRLGSGQVAFRAARSRVVALIRRLDARFQTHRGEMTYNPAYGLHFVPDDRGYWFQHTCADATAGWLRELECTVSWVPIRVGLTVAAPADGPDR